MKLIYILIFLFSQLLFSQNVVQSLSFNDLLFTYKNNYEEVSNRLTSKNYFLDDTYESNGYETAVWRFNDENDATFIAKICLEKECGRTHVQTYNMKLYKSLKNNAIKYGFKYTDSERVEKFNSIYSYYKLGEYILSFSEGIKNNKPYFTVSLEK